RARQRLDRLHQRIARIDVHAGRTIAQALARRGTRVSITTGHGGPRYAKAGNTVSDRTMEGPSGATSGNKHEGDPGGCPMEHRSAALRPPHCSRCPTSSLLAGSAPYHSP